MSKTQLRPRSKFILILTYIYPRGNSGLASFYPGGNFSQGVIVGCHTGLLSEHLLKRQRGRVWVSEISLGSSDWRRTSFKGRSDGVLVAVV